MHLAYSRDADERINVLSKSGYQDKIALGCCDPEITPTFGSMFSPQHIHTPHICVQFLVITDIS